VHGHPINHSARASHQTDIQALAYDQVKFRQDEDNRDGTVLEERQKLLFGFGPKSCIAAINAVPNTVQLPFQLSHTRTSCNESLDFLKIRRLCSFKPPRIMDD